MDPAIALRTCRADGLLIKPHTPIAALDESLLAGPAFNSVPLLASCTSEHEAGRWTYVVAMHANPGDEPVVGEIPLSSVFPLSRFEDGESAGRMEEEDRGVAKVVAWNWRRQTAEHLSTSSVIPVALEHEEWEFFVLAPMLPPAMAVFGDITKFATAGDARIEVFCTPTGVRMVVKGRGENVTITGWAEAAPSSPDGHVEHDAATGVWSVDVAVPARGWTSIRIDGAPLPATS